MTGGTGSFGRKFVEVALRDHDPKVVRVYSRDELKQLEMQREIDDDRVRYFIGDVRDRERLRRAMRGVEVVVHAAALKQVPTAEYNPIEAVKTNVDGAANVIDAAIDCDIERGIFLSSDKAVRPINLYGATKLVAEKLFIQANSYVGGGATRFSCVRYGNVLGSRGSVIPLFLTARRNGVIRITVPEMTRFWITLEQGVQFVMDCVGRMEGGEVFVPKLPAMRLEDLARTIAPEARWEVIGMRPGEKLHEELITREEAPRTREFKTFYTIEPEHRFWGVRSDGDPSTHGQPLPPGFEYVSNTAPWMLTPEELRGHLEELGAAPEGAP